METLQVQSAGAAATTLPASTILSGAPAGDGSFALTLGGALATIPSSVSDGSSIAPKASGKGTASGNSDSASMAGTLLNCFVTNILAPAPTVAQSANVPESSPSFSSAESTADSSSDFASRLNTSVGATSPNSGTLSITAAAGGVPARSTWSAWAGQGVEPTENAKPDASKPTARERVPVAIQSSGPVPTTGQNLPEGTAAAQSLSAPAWLPELQDNSLFRRPIEPSVGETLPKLKPAQASNARSAQESGPRQESQPSPGLTNSWPSLGQLEPAQTPAAPQLLSSQDLLAACIPTPPEGQQIASNPPPAVGQADQAALMFAPEASDPSPPFSPSDHAERAEFSSRLENFAGADLPPASNPPLPASQADHTAPLFASKTSDPSTPSSAGAHPELAEFSSRLGKFAGAEISVRVSGNDSPQAAAPEKSPTGSAPVAAGVLSSGLPKPVVASAQIPATPKSEDWADNPAKGTIHPAQVSNTTATEVGWQKVTEPAATSAQAPAFIFDRPGPVAAG